VRGEADESCIWVAGSCEPLTDVSFRRLSAGGPRSPWHVTSADGRLDLAFEPEGSKSVKHQLGLFAIDYFQLFGSYRGTLAGRPLDSVHGVCESFRARL